MVDPKELRRRRLLSRSDVQRAVGDPVNPHAARSPAELSYLAGRPVDPFSTWSYFRSLYRRR